MSESCIPRLEINLDKLFHNALTLVTRLKKKGISVTGVTKATLGMPEIAKAWIRAGVLGLGDSRIENLKSMREAQINIGMSLIRSPMLSQTLSVVSSSNLSFNSEMSVLRQLSADAKRVDSLHAVLLLVELGDLREGIMPEDLSDMVRQTLRLPNLQFMGIGANLACRSGVSPDQENMGVLSRLADSLDNTFGSIVKVVSGGNSANLNWELNQEGGRVNNLRLGESLLLGCDPLNRKAIKGLYTDAISLVVEVIELKQKPAQPWGIIAQSAFGNAPSISSDKGTITQAILAIGRQDIDLEGLLPPPCAQLLSASSDHLVMNADHYKGALKVGSLITFQLNYSALLRAMTSPFIAKVITHQSVKVTGGTH